MATPKIFNDKSGHNALWEYEYKKKELFVDYK